MGDTSWGGDLNSSLVPEHLCPCALHGNKVSPDPFLLFGAVAVLLFLLCCHGNAACIHPWSCLSPSCRSPVSCLQLTLGCFHPCSSLHPSLVLQPVSATRLLPRDFRGVLPSLPTLDKTLLRDERKAGGGGGQSPGYLLCLCRSFAAAAGARPSEQEGFIKPTPPWSR